MGNRKFSTGRDIQSLKKINEEAVNAKAAEGTVSQKIGDFWQSAMDTVALDKGGNFSFKKRA